MKKVLSLVLALCMMLAIVPSVSAQQPYEISLNGEWDFKYYANAKDVPEDVTKIAFEDKIQVPGAMEMQGYGYPSYFYEEVTGWGMPEDDGVRSAGVYKIQIPSGLGEYVLRFENASDKLKVYIDGEKIAESKNGAVGTDVINVPVNYKEATLICVVERDKSGINKADDFALSGLLGDVVATNVISLSNAKVDVEVKENSVVIDGEEVVLKGVKYTPTHPEYGNAITEEQIDKDLELIKEYGFNAVWVSAAPEYFYAKAEKLGLYVIDEANVNLSYADRDMETAKARIKAMIEKHSYGSVIMWSVGSGEGNNKGLIDYVKELDPTRVVAQEVTFAPDFKVFGNTGGMSDWVATLGDGNVGGFVDEFADKELYYTQNAYVFDVKDSVTGETVTVDGEVENYKGVQYLGDASYVRDIEKQDKYTIVTELSTVEGDRVILESGNVKFEVRGGRARFNVGNARARADVQEGKIAAVYADGEIQIFVNNGFAENAVADAEIEGSYTVGGGETAIKYVEIYNDALTLEELLEGADKSKLISRVQFDDINIKEDKSYKFLAYGGDFGDNPNSYYKCLTGIFSSTREPHPEAEEFKALFAKNWVAIYEGWSEATSQFDSVVPVTGENSVKWSTENVVVEANYKGEITRITDNGKELLTGNLYPTVLRENTLSEYEMAVEQTEGWRTNKAEIIDNTLYVELASTVTEGKLILAYTMTTDGAMHISVQSQFADNATKPTFIGFRGEGDYDNVTWWGYESSTYPDRVSNNKLGTYTRSISEMSDNYAVPQENGNRRVVEYFTLKNEEGYAITFSSPCGLECQALDYSPEAMEVADHDEDIVREDKAYFRVGGYIAGVSNNSEYKLNNNLYGYSFEIIPGTEKALSIYDVHKVVIDNETYKAFAPHIKEYVYQTNKAVEVKGATQDDKKAVIGDYTIYFAPATEYMSDIEPSEKSAEIAKDKDFSGNAIAVGSDPWAAATVYDKGIAIKGGSVTYDVSGMTSHTFNAVVGKTSIDWRRMGGGFDRNMFEASVNVTIALDGVVVEEVKDISMRGGAREVNIDVSNAKEMTITVEGNGRAPQYEDALLANAAFVPSGPIVVNFEKVDGKATITVLNTDKEQVDVVLTATENGIVTTEAVSMGKGLYRTVEVKAGENAFVKAYVTGIGEIAISND